MAVNFSYRGGTGLKNAACVNREPVAKFDRLRKYAFGILVALLITFAAFSNSDKTSGNTLYPSVNKRTISPGNTNYFINPVNGSDTGDGLTKITAWKSFSNINKLKLTEGDTVNVLSAGPVKTSLFIHAEGTKTEPVVIKLAEGRYDFYPESAVKRKFSISNTNDAPDALKAVALYFLKCKNVKVEGNGAGFVFRGKVMEAVIDSSENISIEGISFDYARPTVSEMKILTVTDTYADVRIHKDSKYVIDNKTLIWKGEGWEHKVQPLWQVFNPENDKVRRKSLPVNTFSFETVSPEIVRIYFTANPGFNPGQIWQNRNTFRDYAAVFTRNSKNTEWKNVNIYFMHGMGFVNQFSENILFDNLRVAPRDGSGRTCAAWADILHFSGCKGKIEVRNSLLSAANDDAINIHGTHLRLIGKTPEKTVKVKFMHPQTYGFQPFFKGDSVEFINSETLLPYAVNVVENVKKINEKAFELTLKNPFPQKIKKNDVLENTTRTASFTMKNTTIKHIPTRGILITTRRKVIIEENFFYKTFMSAVLIADDARNWYESGYVNDVTVRNNKFIKCGAPVINIHPENRSVEKGRFVHDNITITNNFFDIIRLPVVAAKSTGNLVFKNNKITGINIPDIKDLIKPKDCGNIDID
ncbi:MAG: alpha-1,3-galactosidase [Chlorobi bacterium]|nr:alpha-1,3-galactosidase [Chlorobiota bacterium]